MANKRKLIREAIVQRLIDAGTTAGSKVYENRTRPVWEGSLPAINVWTESETPILINEAPKIYERTLIVVIEAYASARADIDDDLDALSNQIEAIFDNEDRFSLQGETSDIVYAGTEMGLIGTGSRETGVVRISYRVKYITRSGASGSSLDDFGKITSSYALVPGELDQTETDDTIILPTV